MIIGCGEGVEGTEEWMVERRNNGDEGRVGLMLIILVAGVMGNVLEWWST